MGITVSDIVLIERALVAKPDIKTVCELGSQNLYLPGLSHTKPPFASEWYKERRIEYHCIDLAGDNGAMVLDLAVPIELNDKYDLVTDFGTSEHVTTVSEIQKVAFHEGHIHSIYPDRSPSLEEIWDGFYYCWMNKHNLLDVGGIMINVNPKTGSWPGHGFTYLTLNFYYDLIHMMGYELVWLNENPAMGNTKSGWNIECVLQKKDDREFLSFDDFRRCEQLLK